KRGTKRGRPESGSHKTPVFGMVERGGRVVAQVVPDVKAATVIPEIQNRVLPYTMIYTDEYMIYNPLKSRGYWHRRVHHAAKIYVDGDVHTNTIEGFFGLVKTGIRGVYHSVSRKHLQSYLDEYTFRYNHRKDARPMFQIVLGQIAKG
ncbi:MAG TPA: IS1595 family transposase, partial [Candidatus Bathyarchaeia archaeon]